MITLLTAITLFQLFNKTIQSNTKFQPSTFIAKESCRDYRESLRKDGKTTSLPGFMSFIPLPQQHPSRG
jgi:hypothetical protein